AYADLAMWPQAAAAFRHILPLTKGPLGQEAALRLGDALVNLEKKAEARTHYQSIADTKSQSAAWGRFRLATLDLDEGQPAACIERCRRLLEEPNSIARADLFGLMG